MTDTETLVARFHAWQQEAAAHPGVVDATAMALATVGEDGAPSIRIVLLKEADGRGFTFFTNRESRKGRELAAHPQVALCFHWAPLERQVRIEGGVEQVSDAESDVYFASRPRESQIGAWASAQSRGLESMKALEARIEEERARFEGRDVPRPPYWGGYRLVPRRIEFWQQRAYRLHERELFIREGERWRLERLFP